jgi:chemotaxis protein CheC
MLGETVPPEELSEYEQEAMCEVGNIILNACISALADLFCVEFEGTLPEYQYADRHTLDLIGTMDGEVPVVLVVQIDLTIKKQCVQGHLMFLLSVSSLQELMDSIDRFLAGQGIT